MARACLTGALVGGKVGPGAIPERFIQGLEGHDELVSLCKRLGELAERLCDEACQIELQGFSNAAIFPLSHLCPASSWLRECQYIATSGTGSSRGGS